MAEKLVALFCTAEVSDETLSEIISTAYTSEPEFGHNILFVNNADFTKGPKPTGPTEPPLSSVSKYPFLSKSLEELGAFVNSIPSDWPVSRLRFLVADKQTTEDNTLLFVEPEDPEPDTVRLDARRGNSIPVCVQIGTMDIPGISSLTDDNGIYRGDPSDPPPERGGPAPRKELRSRNIGK